MDYEHIGSRAEYVKPFVNFTRPDVFIIHENTKYLNLLLIFTFFLFSVKYQVLILASLAGSPDILNYFKRNGGFGTAKTPNLCT